MMSALLFRDFNGDGFEDILLAGNFYPYRVQQGRVDAGRGCLLKGNGKGSFTVVERKQSGLMIPGDVRDMMELKGSDGTLIVVSKNNDAVQVIREKKHLRKY